MSIYIRTTVASLDAQRNLAATSRDLEVSFQRLSSGYRINSAADDAAGLAISEKMRAQVTGTNQAIRNANDGISLIQTAEGGLNEIQNIVQRMRELAVQAANGTLVTSDQKAIAKEMTQLKSEVNNISSRTKFNGIALLGTGSSTVTLQVGSNDGQTMEVSFESFKTDGDVDGMASFGDAVGDFNDLASASSTATLGIGASSGRKRARKAARSGRCPASRSAPITAASAP